MPNYLVIIEARYAIDADTPKKAFEEVLERSEHPDMLTMRTEDDDA